MSFHINLEKNVVHKIQCKKCDASYVGQTGRQLKSRMSEHKNLINRNIANHSVITEHRLDFEHEFDWDNIKILDNERFLDKKLIFEILILSFRKMH